MSDLLQKYGFAEGSAACVDADEQRVLFNGHLRSDLAADSLVPVQVTDLTAEEALALLRALDPTTAMAQEDEDALRELVAAVDDADPEALLPASEPETSGPAESAPDEAWKTLSFRLPAGAVPVIEQQVERIADLCGYDHKTRGLVLERRSVACATLRDDAWADG